MKLTRRDWLRLAALAPALEPVRYWKSTARRVEGLLYTLEQEARAGSS